MNPSTVSNDKKGENMFYIRLKYRPMVDVSDSETRKCGVHVSECVTRKCRVHVSECVT